MRSFPAEAGACDQVSRRMPSGRQSLSDEQRKRRWRAEARRYASKGAQPGMAVPQRGKKRRRGDGAPPRMNNAQADGKLPSCSGFDGRKSRRAGSIRARRMAEPGLAIARAAVRVCGDVENDVVRMRRVAGKQACGARNCRLRAGGGHVIKTEEISHAPGDVVVRAGSVSTDANSADKQMAVRIEAQAAAKDVYAADFASNHGVSGGAVVRGGSGVGYAGIDRIAVLQSIEAAARLDGRIEVCRG